MEMERRNCDGMPLPRSLKPFTVEEKELGFWFFLSLDKK